VRSNADCFVIAASSGAIFVELVLVFRERAEVNSAPLACCSGRPILTDQHECGEKYGFRFALCGGCDTRVGGGI
jgi:hypothetical protein